MKICMRKHFPHVLFTNCSIFTLRNIIVVQLELFVPSLNKNSSGNFKKKKYKRVHWRVKIVWESLKSKVLQKLNNKIEKSVKYYFFLSILFKFLVEKLPFTSLLERKKRNKKIESITFQLSKRAVKLKEQNLCGKE